MSRLRPYNHSYSILENLGEGLNSRVYKALRSDSKEYTRETVALKFLKSEKNVSNLRNEFEALKSVSSDNIVGLKCWENFENGPALVLEYIEGCTLAEIWQDLLLDEGLVAEVIQQAYLGLRDLDRCGLCHGDINPHNILIDKKGVVKLIDVGPANHSLGTPQYLAPERWCNENASFSSDLFSLGLIQRELMCVDLDDHLTWRQRAFRLSETQADWLSKDQSIRVMHQPQLETSKREELKKIVEKKLKMKKRSLDGTQVLNTLGRSRKKIYGGLYYVVVMLMLFTLSSDANVVHKNPSIISVITKKWAEVFINEKSIGYSPILLKRVDSGMTKVKIKYGFGETFQKSIFLKPGRKYVLKGMDFL